MDLSNKNVIHVKKNGIEYLQFRKLLEYSEIITHAYSLGIDMNFRTAKTNKEKLPEDQLEKALNNYERLGNSIGIELKHIAKPNQKHTDNVQIVNKKILADEPDFNLEKYNQTDGLITNKPGIALGSTNADCILIYIFDPIKRVIANIHSGWRGTFQKIGEKAVKKMINEYDCNPQDLIVCMCPSIRKCHFEVGEEVATECKDIFEYTGKMDDIMEKTSEDKWHIDTILINRILFKNLGIKEENIIDSGLCSVCNSDIIHSYRVEKEGYGLSTALIELK